MTIQMMSGMKKISYGLYADIHAGAEVDAHLEALGEHLGEMVWK